MTRTVLLVAGEASGDLRGAELMGELERIDPAIRLIGVGGERLREAGMELLVDTAELSIMGFTEVMGRLPTVLRAYRKVRDAIRGELADVPQPDLVILIDFPDFNLRLARVAQHAGVPVLYYVSPQVWAWRRYRVRTLARRVDRLAVVFPFEEELYRGLTQVTFVGHPALETVRATRSREDTLRRLGFLAERPLVTLLPGSRAAEVRELLPAMVEATRRLGRQVHVVVALAHERLRTLAQSLCGGTIPLVAGETYELIAAADLVLLASGSASLETALLGRPMVILYRLSPASYAVARLLVRVPHIGMPNLILGRRAVPELIQSAVTPDRIAAEARAILDDPARAAAMREDLAQVRTRLGAPGAARRAAEIAAQMLAEAGSRPTSAAR